MDMFFGAVKAFFDTFSAVVFVPMIMFVINLAFKVKPKKGFYLRIVRRRRPAGL